MRELKVITLVILCSSSFLFPQVDEKLKNDIRNTGYIHSPLPLDYSKSFETFGLTKKVLVSDVLCDMEDLSQWSHSGIGSMSQTAERSISGKHSLRLVAPSYVDEIPKWGLGRGTSMACFDVGGKNWEKYNRIHLTVYPDCEGARTVYLNLYVENDGKIKRSMDFFGPSSTRWSSATWTVATRAAGLPASAVRTAMRNAS